MADTSTGDRWTLRDLPFAARFTLAVFLVSVGIGYLAALIQLHFQHASPGNMLPSPDDAVKIFHGHVGDKPISRFEQLIAADESLRFNGTGQMSEAFTTQSDRWKAIINRRALKLRKGRGIGAPTDEEIAKAKAALLLEREGEKEVVLAWLRSGASKEDWEKDKFCLPAELVKKPITKDYLNEEDPDGPSVKIKLLLQDRCVTCHIPTGGRHIKAAKFPLETWEQIKKYVTVETATAMSLDKLAQTTHVHLLGFSMLYGLTGLLFALTRYWGWVRGLLAPLPLVAQVVDISFWWLARLDAPYGPMFARGIAVTGAVVATALLLQLLLTLFDLFGRSGKAVLILLVAAAIGGGIGLKQKVIDKHMATEVPSVNAKK